MSLVSLMGQMIGCVPRFPMMVESRKIVFQRYYSVLCYSTKTFKIIFREMLQAGMLIC